MFVCFIGYLLYRSSSELWFGFMSRVDEPRKMNIIKRGSGSLCAPETEPRVTVRWIHSIDSFDSFD